MSKERRTRIQKMRTQARRLRARLEAERQRSAEDRGARMRAEADRAKAERLAAERRHELDMVTDTLRRFARNSIALRPTETVGPRDFRAYAPPGIYPVSLAAARAHEWDEFRPLELVHLVIRTFDERGPVDFRRYVHFWVKTQAGPESCLALALSREALSDLRMDPREMGDYIARHFGEALGRKVAAPLPR